MYFIKTPEFSLTGPLLILSCTAPVRPSMASDIICTTAKHDHFDSTADSTCAESMFYTHENMVNNRYSYQQQLSNSQTIPTSTLSSFFWIVHEHAYTDYDQQNK